MRVTKVHLGALSGRLTCSEVMQILMNQPTTPQGRRIEAHSHMHVTEGFRLGQQGFSGDAFSLARKKKHWENPTHLYPQGSDADSGRMVYGPGDSGKSYGYGGVMQDGSRLPSTREYADRTGLPLLPRVDAPETFTVFRKQAGGKPIKETYSSMGEVNALNAANYICEKGGAIRCTRVPGAMLLPQVKESPAHTLFPDSESQVMHLTAALRSDAGIYMLHHLAYTLGAGSPQTVGIFSKTAVRVVAAVDTGVPVRMLERRLEVDQTAARNPATGQYPATGNTITSESGIDHVVVVLGNRADGELNIITCYPSRQTTGDTIETATAADEDIAEPAIGTHIKYKQTRPLRLSW